MPVTVSFCGGLEGIGGATLLGRGDFTGGFVGSGGVPLLGRGGVKVGLDELGMPPVCGGCDKIAAGLAGTGGAALLGRGDFTGGFVGSGGEPSLGRGDFKGGLDESGMPPVFGGCDKIAAGLAGTGGASLLGRGDVLGGLVGIGGGALLERGDFAAGFEGTRGGILLERGDFVGGLDGIGGASLLGRGVFSRGFERTSVVLVFGKVVGKLDCVGGTSGFIRSDVGSSAALVETRDIEGKFGALATEAVLATCEAAFIDDGVDAVGRAGANPGRVAVGTVAALEALPVMVELELGDEGAPGEVAFLAFSLRNISLREAASIVVCLACFRAATARFRARRRFSAAETAPPARPAPAPYFDAPRAPLRIV